MKIAVVKEVEYGEEPQNVSIKDDDRKSTSSSSSSEEENDAEAEEEQHQDNMEPDADLKETEESSKEVIDAPSTSYAKLVTPSGFIAPSSSLSSQQQYNADDSDVPEKELEQLDVEPISPVNDEADSSSSSDDESEKEEEIIETPEQDVLEEPDVSSDGNLPDPSE